MVQGYQTLTEKEKQTLRLLLDGHDAKSMARHLGLSVHTVNERLRDARRKLSVSSSKAAARLLRHAERADPEIVGDTPLGDAGSAPGGQSMPQPDITPRRTRRAVWTIGVLAMISLCVAMLALSAPAERPGADATEAARSVAETETSRAARDWLTLVDDGKWQESWARTTQSFRSLNTVQVWQSTSEKVRVPLGRVLSRTLVNDQDVPAPPNGYRLVQFHTDFANRQGATETVSLDREGGSWKIVGIYIE